MRCTIRDELDAESPERFWRDVFFSERVQEQIYRELGYREARILSQSGDLETGLRRSFVFVQSLSTPGPLKKLFGAQQTLTEHGVFDAARQEYRFETVPEGALGERISVRGVTRVEQTRPGKITRICELDCTCSIPALGGLTERFIAKANEEIYARRTQIERRILSEPPAPT